MAKVKAVPEGMHTVTPQIALDGAAEALELYKRTFGAEEHSRAPDPTGKKIWHSAMRIGDSTVFVNDVFPDMGGAPQHAHLWLYLENVDAAFKRAVDAGCTVRMPMSDMFWGDRMGTLSDRWGNQWTLSQRIKDMTPDDMKKAQDAFVAQMKK